MKKAVFVSIIGLSIILLALITFRKDIASFFLQAEGDDFVDCRYEYLNDDQSSFINACFYSKSNIEIYLHYCDYQQFSDSFIQDSYLTFISRIKKENGHTFQSCFVYLDSCGRDGKKEVLIKSSNDFFGRENLTIVDDAKGFTFEVTNPH